MVLPGLLFQRAYRGAVLAILVCVSTISLRAAEPAEVTGTMPEDYFPELKTILAQSLTRSPEQISRSFEHVIQEAKLTMAKAARLPSLGGNFDYGITETATASNTSSRSSSTGAQYSFNVGQPLFHWGAIKNEIEIAKLNLTSTDRETARIYRDASSALRKAYLALIVEKARITQLRRSQALVEADVEVAKTKKRDGTISGAVLAGEELRLREIRLVVSRNTAEFDANRARFARAAGLPQPLAEEAIPDDIPRPDGHETLAAAIVAKTMAENGRGTLEFEIYDLKLYEASLRQKIVNTRLLPKFGVGASYGLRNNTTVNGPTVSQEAVTEQRIAVSGNWNIFDGFYTRGAKREAATSRRLIEHKKNVEIDQLLQGVQQLERSLKLDAEQVDLTDTRHGIATNGRKRVVEGVEKGLLPKADLRRSEVNVLDARASSLLARATYLGRWSDLVATAGHDPVLKNLPERNVRKKK